MTTILVLFLLMVIALLLVGLADRWQTRRRQSMLREKRLRLQLQELEAILEQTETALPSRDIARQINAEILRLLEEMRQLSPNNSRYVDSRLNRAEEREGAWDREPPTRKVNRLRDSDAQIAHSQACLKHAGQVLRHRHIRGYLSAEELEVYLQDLGWSQMMVSVVSLIAQGHKALARGGRLAALSFYKKAQNLLAGYGESDSRRAAMIQQLNEIITGERKALSQELMPETEYNPE